MGDYSAAVEEKLALMRRMAYIGDKLTALVDIPEPQPEDNDSFERLLRERKECMEQVDVIDQSLPDDMAYDRECLAEMIELLKRISAADKGIIERVAQETTSLKQQIGEQMERKKSMLLYGTNVLAQKSMILDEEG